MNDAFPALTVRGPRDKLDLLVVVVLPADLGRSPQPDEPLGVARSGKQRHARLGQLHAALLSEGQPPSYPSPERRSAERRRPVLADDAHGGPAQVLDLTPREQRGGTAPVWRHLYGAALVRARDAAAVEHACLEGAREGGGRRVLLAEVRG